MTPYEQWSLALTAIGHLFVASSILYAARQWLVSQRSLEREIKKDTRQYISSINEQIHIYQREIIENNLDPWESSHGIDDCRALNRLLNTIEGIAVEIDSDFYDKEMLQKHFTVHGKAAWEKWKPYIENLRTAKGSSTLWVNIEKQAMGYNNAN